MSNLFAKLRWGGSVQNVLSLAFSLYFLGGQSEQCLVLLGLIFALLLFGLNCDTASL